MNIREKDWERPIKLLGKINFKKPEKWFFAKKKYWKVLKCSEFRAEQHLFYEIC
jgi:hypothetical protein